MTFLLQAKYFFWGDALRSYFSQMFISILPCWHLTVLCLLQCLFVFLYRQHACFFSPPYPTCFLILRPTRMVPLETAVTCSWLCQTDRKRVATQLHTVISAIIVKGSMCILYYPSVSGGVMWREKIKEHQTKCWVTPSFLLLFNSHILYMTDIFIFTIRKPESKAHLFARSTYSNLQGFD